MTDNRELLASNAPTWRPSSSGRSRIVPSPGRSTWRRSGPASAVPLPESAMDPRRGRRGARGRGRPGPGRHGRAALLRVRDRRRRAGGPGDRLADLDVGSERRLLRDRRPAAAVAEEVAARLAGRPAGLPADTGVGFATGATMANFTALAAARHRVLATRGLGRRAAGPAGCRRRSRSSPTRGRTSRSTPRSRCSASAARAIASGGSRPTSRAGCAPMRFARPSPPIDGPVIVCSQAGNVNSGAFDPLADLIPIAHERGPGCTSTVPSASGRRRSPRCAT